MKFCSIKNRERTMPKIDLEVERERTREGERKSWDDFPLLRRIVWLIFVEYFESLLAHS